MTLDEQIVAQQNVLKDARKASNTANAAAAIANAKATEEEYKLQNLLIEKQSLLG